MTPSTHHFVSLQSIYNRINKICPSLTTKQFRGWHGRRKLIDELLKFGVLSFESVAFKAVKLNTDIGTIDLKILMTIKAQAPETALFFFVLFFFVIAICAHSIKKRKAFMVINF